MIRLSFQKETLTTTAEKYSGLDRMKPRHQTTSGGESLIEIERDCAFEKITAEDLLTSNIMTAITHAKLRDKSMKKRKWN